jgi:hypothetical protein
MKENSGSFIRQIVFGESVLAIVLKAEFKENGIKFFTPNHFSQQLGYMNRPSGYVIEPHLHNSVLRNVEYTNEVLFIKSGKVRVDFYTPEKNYIESLILNTGDIVLLASGGHGFEILEDSEIVEVKQGPYVGDHDKTRFPAVHTEKLNIN